MDTTTAATTTPTGDIGAETPRHRVVGLARTRSSWSPPASGPSRHRRQLSPAERRYVRYRPPRQRPGATGAAGARCLGVPARACGNRRGDLDRHSGSSASSSAAFESVYYTSAVGPSGDDFTGLLAIPAGLVLVALGVVGLWRSRRQTPNRWWRYLRRLLLSLAALMAVYQLSSPWPWPTCRPMWLAPRCRRRTSGRRTRTSRCTPATVSSSEAGTSRPRTAPPSSRSRAGRGRRSRPGCWSSTGTACCCSTVAARA